MKSIILTEKQLKEWAKWYSENVPVHDPDSLNKQEPMDIADTILEFAYKFGEVVD